MGVSGEAYLRRHHCRRYCSAPFAVDGRCSIGEVCQVHIVDCRIYIVTLVCTDHFGAALIVTHACTQHMLAHTNGPEPSFPCHHIH